MKRAPATASWRWNCGLGLVAIAVAIVEDRAEARADAIRIEERLNAIENRLTASETSKATSANASFATR